MEGSNLKEIAALFSAGEYKKITEKFSAVGASSDEVRLIAQAAYLLSDLSQAKDLLLTASIRFSDNASLWHDLAFYQSKSGEFLAAENSISACLKLRPDYAASLLLAGNIYKALNRFDDAILKFRQAAGFKEDRQIALNNLATTLVKAGRYDEAENIYMEALPFGQLNTSYNYANLLEMRGENQKAITVYKEIVEKNPDFFAAWNNLGQVFLNSSELAEAEKCFDKALFLKPELAEAKLNKAKLFLLRGDAEKSRALLKEPADSAFANMAQINLCYVSNFSDRISAAQLADEHRKLYRQLLPDFPEIKLKSYKNKKTRLGYLSADFRQHSVAYFIEGLLRTHDKEKFEVYLYANQILHDGVTQKIRSQADFWIEVKHFSDQELTDKIRADQIDILIDLSGLTNGHRAMVLAKRAAPIQINYLGYPHSSGIPNIDYRIVDSITDPSEKFATEKLIHLNPCFICYQEDNQLIANEPEKPFTFGCFNALAKLSDSLLECWAEILKRVPESRLLLKAYGISDKKAKADLIGRFKKLGISESRLIFEDYKADKSEHLSFYNKVDLALDSFPYCGTTTTCEALSMNVPVLTLSGERHAARVGHSLLSAAGLSELISMNSEDYIDKAVNLAKAPLLLKELKQKLSSNFKSSALCNQQEFTRKLEEILIRL